MLQACEHDAFKSGEYGECKFSTDTIMFDTIFTNIGTNTFKLVIKNPNNYNLEFDSIYLAAKGTAGFIVNIDGRQTLSVKNVTIDAKDSLYIFVQAFLPFSNVNSPFLNQDSLVFVSGNHISDVKLIAFGQNVNAFHDVHIQSQEWTNIKPYLIYGTLTLDSGYNLTIHEGVKVYFHKNAKLQINGTLKVYGLDSAPVNFKSDRLEKDYDTIPGQWGGIYLNGTSGTHIINHAVIRNGTIGIHVGQENNNSIVNFEISNTLISNMGYSALIAYQANITAKNCVFANTVNTVCIIYGGSYEFLHCSLANFGTKYISRSFGSQTLLLSNYLEYYTKEGEKVTISKNIEKAYFGNTVIFGNSADEIKILKRSESEINYTFENCLLKIANSSLPANDPRLINCIVNESPVFIRPENENFRLGTLSFAKDKGKKEIGQMVPVDLDNNSRIIENVPDIGAYERIGKQ